MVRSELTLGPAGKSVRPGDVRTSLGRNGIGHKRRQFEQGKVFERSY